MTKQNWFERIRRMVAVAIFTLGVVSAGGVPDFHAPQGGHDGPLRDNDPLQAPREGAAASGMAAFRGGAR